MVPVVALEGMFGTEANWTVSRTVQNGKIDQSASVDPEDVKGINDDVVPAKAPKRKVVEPVVVVNVASWMVKLFVGIIAEDEDKVDRDTGIVPRMDFQEASINVLVIEDVEDQVPEVRKIFMYQATFDEASNLVQKSKRMDLYSIHTYWVFRIATTVPLKRNGTQRYSSSFYMGIYHKTDNRV